MTDTKHTQTPWAIHPFKLDLICTADGQKSIAGAYNQDISSYEEIAANAAHIVKCVNMHDELVAALQALESVCKFSKDSFLFKGELEDARAALSKAGA